MKKTNELPDELLKALFPPFNPTRELADPYLVLFYKNLENRELWLDKGITWDDCSFIIQYIEWMNREEMDENPKPITLHIMSYGGDVSVMFAVYDCIKSSRIPIITINEGICYSAAFVIFLAGTERRMRPNAVFCAHEGSGGISGSYRESKAAMTNYEKDVEALRAIISEETDLSPEEIERHFSQEIDWYIRKEEAEKYNILK